MQGTSAGVQKPPGYSGSFNALAARATQSMSSLLDGANSLGEAAAKSAPAPQLGGGVGRRGGAFLSSTGSFTLSSGTNTVPLAILLLDPSLLPSG